MAGAVGVYPMWVWSYWYADGDFRDSRGPAAAASALLLRYFLRNLSSMAG